jgi:hypothetical protein
MLTLGDELGASLGCHLPAFHKTGDELGEEELGEQAVLGVKRRNNT